MNFLWKFADQSSFSVLLSCARVMLNVNCTMTVARFVAVQIILFHSKGKDLNCNEIGMVFKIYFVFFIKTLKIRRFT